MSGKLRLYVVVSTHFVLSACGGAAKITFDPASPRTYESKDPTCQIEVFDAEPDGDYVEIGIINYHHERHRTSDGSLKLEIAMPQIKKIACEVGADAVMDVHVTDRNNLEWRLFHVTARAIRFEP